MLKELKKDMQYLYVIYELVKKHSNKIKIVIEDEIVYQDKILSDLVFELRTFKIGKFIRLYVEKNGEYMFLDKEIISYNIIRLSKEKICNFTNMFMQDLESVLSEN